MIKTITLDGNTINYNTITQDGFDPILGFYDRKIRRTVSSWVKNIPDHDIDDLSQVCRIKLVEALDNFDDKSGVSFTTYVYTVWKRKLSQLSYKYKTKKYSRKIENDNYISPNYAYDKHTESFYLRVNKNKCPISKEVITPKTCLGCQYSCGYSSKEITRGKEEGKVERFSKCKYFKSILEQRGIHLVSIDQPMSVDRKMSSNRSEVVLSNMLRDHRDDYSRAELSMEIERLKPKMDATSFIILQLLSEGFSKKDIIDQLNIDKNVFGKHIRRLGNNNRLKRIITLR